MSSAVHWRRILAVFLVDPQMADIWSAPSSTEDVSYVLPFFYHAHFVRVLCPKALGIDVEMPGGVGILVPHPLKDPADFEARIPTQVDVKDKLSHVIQAVTRIKEVSSLGHAAKLGKYRFPNFIFMTGHQRICGALRVQQWSQGYDEPVSAVFFTTR